MVHFRSVKFSCFVSVPSFTREVNNYWKVESWKKKCLVKLKKPDLIYRKSKSINPDGDPQRSRRNSRICPISHFRNLIVLERWDFKPIIEFFTGSGFSNLVILIRMQSFSLCRLKISNNERNDLYYSQNSISQNLLNF